MIFYQLVLKYVGYWSNTLLMVWCVSHTYICLKKQTHPPAPPPSPMDLLVIIKFWHFMPKIIIIWQFLKILLLPNPFRYYNIFVFNWFTCKDHERIKFLVKVNKHPLTHHARWMSCQQQTFFHCIFSSIANHGGNLWINHLHSLTYQKTTKCFALNPKPHIAPIYICHVLSCIILVLTFIIVHKHIKQMT